MRLAARAQEDAEIVELRRAWPFRGYILTDHLLRQLIRQTAPWRVARAIRLCHEGYLNSRCAWSDALIRKALISFTLPTSAQQ